MKRRKILRGINRLRNKKKIKSENAVVFGKRNETAHKDGPAAP